MKECPVCSAVTFDDMDICYGCLHRFGGADAIAASATAGGKGAFAVQPANGSLAGRRAASCLRIALGNKAVRIGPPAHTAWKSRSCR